MKNIKIITSAIGVAITLSLAGCATDGGMNSPRGYSANIHNDRYERPTNYQPNYQPNYQIHPTVQAKSVIHPSPEVKTVKLNKIPSYYLDYSTGYNKDGLFIASGYGQGATMTAALEEASNNARVRFAQTKGSSTVSSLTRHFNDAHTGTGYHGVEKYNNGNQAESSTSSVDEIATSNVNVGHIYVLARRVYKTADGFESYILLSNKPKNPNINYNTDTKGQLNRETKINAKERKVNAQLYAMNNKRVEHEQELHDLHKKELTDLHSKKIKNTK